MLEFVVIKIAGLKVKKNMLSCSNDSENMLNLSNDDSFGNDKEVVSLCSDDYVEAKEINKRAEIDLILNRIYKLPPIVKAETLKDEEFLGSSELQDTTEEKFGFNDSNSKLQNYKIVVPHLTGIFNEEIKPISTLSIRRFASLDKLNIIGESKENIEDVKEDYSEESKSFDYSDEEIKEGKYENTLKYIPLWKTPSSAFFNRKSKIFSNINTQSVSQYKELLPPKVVDEDLLNEDQLNISYSSNHEDYSIAIEVTNNDIQNESISLSKALNDSISKTASIGLKNDVMDTEQKEKLDYKSKFSISPNSNEDQYPLQKNKTLSSKKNISEFHIKHSSTKGKFEEMKDELSRIEDVKEYENEDNSMKLLLNKEDTIKNEHMVQTQEEYKKNYEKRKMYKGISMKKLNENQEKRNFTPSEDTNENIPRSKTKFFERKKNFGSFLNLDNKGTSKFKSFFGLPANDCHDLQTLKKSRKSRIIEIPEYTPKPNRIAEKYESTESELLLRRHFYTLQMKEKKAKEKGFDDSKADNSENLTDDDNLNEDINEYDDEGSLESTSTTSSINPLYSVRSAIDEKYVPKVLKIMNVVAIILFFIILGIGITYYVIENIICNFLSGNISNIDYSEKRLSWLVEINLDLKTMFILKRYKVLNSKVNETYLATKDHFLNSAIKLINVQDELSLQMKDMTASEKKKINPENLLIEYLMKTDFLPNLYNYTVSQTMLEVMLSAFRIAQQSFDNLSETSFPASVIVKNSLNSIWEALNYSTNEILSQIYLRIDYKLRTFLILLCVVSAAIVISIIIFMPILVSTVNNKDKVLSLFLYLTRKEIRKYQAKCERFKRINKNENLNYEGDTKGKGTSTSIENSQTEEKGDTNVKQEVEKPLLKRKITELHYYRV